MSILFILTTELEIWKSDTVNNTRVLLKKIIPQNSRLELAKNFESIWKEMWSEIDYKNVDSLTFEILDGAGFTDTRILYLWLRSAEMFWHIKIEVISKNHVDGLYTASPRIG